MAPEFFIQVVSYNQPLQVQDKMLLDICEYPLRLHRRAASFLLILQPDGDDSFVTVELIKRRNGKEETMAKGHILQCLPKGCKKKRPCIIVGDEIPVDATKKFAAWSAFYTVKEEAEDAVQDQAVA